MVMFGGMLCGHVEQLWQVGQEAKRSEPCAASKKPSMHGRGRYVRLHHWAWVGDYPNGPQHELFHFWMVNHRIPWDPAQKWLFLAWWYRYESNWFIPQNERCSSKSGQIGGQKMVIQVFLQIARHLIWQYMHGVLVDSFRSPLRIPWAITIIIIIISFSYRSLSLLVAGKMMFWTVDDAGMSEFSD
jgi:hypothetical protein